jgi:hypothetical protein
MKNTSDKNNAASFIGNPQWPAVSDPITLLQEKRLEIIKHMQKLAGYQDVVANSMFLSLVDLTNQLKTIRLNKSMTYDFIEKTVKPLPFGEKYFLLYFLLKATDQVYTYSHAFDGAARILKIYFHLQITFKYAPEQELIAAVEEDADLCIS